jgi:hypothetical protein
MTDVDTPFGTSWEQLGTKELRDFLAGAPREEGFTWEAKGDDDRGEFPRDGFRDAVAGMANGFEVGYVIVGAGFDDVTGRWALNGLRKLPGDEVTTWLDQLIDVLRPRPDVVIKRLEGDLGPAAVARVLPAPVPPVMHKGRLLVRTSGRTIAVVDPGEVRRLVERGERALERAQQDSFVAGNYSRLIPFESPFSPAVTIGLAPTGRRPDVDRHVFRESFAGALRNLFVGWENRGFSRNQLHWQMTTDHVSYWKQADLGSQAGALVSGASYVSWWSGADRNRGLDMAVDGLLDRIWTVAGEVVAELGGFGPSFAYIQVNLPGAIADLARQTTAPVPTTEEIEEGRRFLARRRGDEPFEPE